MFGVFSRTEINSPGGMWLKDNLTGCNKLRWHQRGWDAYLLPSLTPLSKGKLSCDIVGKTYQPSWLLIGAETYQSSPSATKHIESRGFWHCSGRMFEFSTGCREKFLSERENSASSTWQQQTFGGINFPFPWGDGKGHSRHPLSYIKQSTTKGGEEWLSP